MDLVAVQFRAPSSVSGSIVWGWLIMLQQEEIEQHSVDETQVPFNTRTKGRFPHITFTTEIVPEFATDVHGMPTPLIKTPTAHVTGSNESCSK